MLGYSYFSISKKKKILFFYKLVSILETSKTNPIIQNKLSFSICFDGKSYLKIIIHIF